VLNDARARDAQRKADVLVSKLPRLTIRVDAGTNGLAGLEVKRDGLTIGAVAWGIPSPVDPGEHVVEAQAPGYQPLKTTATVKDAESREVTLRLEPIGGVVAPVPVAPAPAVAQAPTAPGALSPSPAGRPFLVRHRASVATGGVAVVLAAAGVGLGIATWQDYVHLASTCVRPCTSTGGVIAEKTATNVLLGVAGAAALTSGVLFVFVERDWGSVSVGPMQRGARVVGRF
jgi:hypothetical protein